VVQTLSTGREMRVLLAGDRSQDRDQCRRAALRIGLDCTAADCVSLADLRLRLSREPAVHLVVVFLDPDPAAGARAITAAKAQTRQPIFAVASSDAEAVGQSARAAGATGVWTPDRIREGLLSSTEEIRRDGSSPERRGRVIAVTSAQPGVGVTTVATGLAFSLAGKASVSLAELGTAVPELALNLDLAPKHSLADLIRAHDRMDASMIRDTAVKHDAGVEVLAYLPETLAAEPLSAASGRDIQILLRHMYNWVVLDAGPRHGIENEELIRHADLVVAVTRLDPASLRLTRKYAQTLVANGVPAANLVLVGNRYGQPGLVPWQKAEEVLRTKVEAWLPDDPKSVNRALTAGRPLVQSAKWSKLTRQFAKLAADLQTKLATT
jgi:pilus assembly protein CpaE